MTLSDRDFFASQALYSLILSTADRWDKASPEEIKAVCEKSFEVADAMIEASKKGPTYGRKTT
jgi:hypothetical protein